MDEFLKSNKAGEAAFLNLMTFLHSIQLENSLIDMCMPGPSASFLQL